MNYLKVSFEFLLKFLALYSIYCLNKSTIKDLYLKIYNRIIYNNIFSILVFFCFFKTLFNKKCAH